MNKLQEATELLKNFGYRIIKESTESFEGMDVSKIENPNEAEKAIKNLIEKEDLSDDVVIAPKSTDDTIYIQVDGRIYLICKNYDVAYDLAVEEEKNYFSIENDLRYCGINLKRFGRTWKEFIKTDDVDLDEIDNDPSYEGIDWEEATSVAEYFDNEFIDWDKVAEFCVDEDGVAHTLARYDEKEIDLENDYLAYRQE